MGKRVVNQAFHLSRSFSEYLLLLTAQFALLLAEFSLLLAERALLLSELSLSFACLGLKVAKFALQVADFFLNAPKIFLRASFSEGFQFGFQFAQVFRHVGNFDANALLLFPERFLLRAQSFLLLAEFFLFLFKRMNLAEKIRRTFHCRLIANHVGLAVMPEPYEISRNFLLQEFNELGWMVDAKAFAIAGNADISFTGRNHKLLTVTICCPHDHRGTCRRRLQQTSKRRKRQYADRSHSLHGS